MTFLQRLEHWVREFAMNRIGSIRLRLKHGSKLDSYLEQKNFKLLEDQMALRRAAGKQEIQCHVIWGWTDD